MNPRLRRLVITGAVLGLAVIVLVLVVVAPGRGSPRPAAVPPAPGPASTAEAAASEQTQAPDSGTPPAPPATIEPLGDLRAAWVQQDAPPQPIGSLDPRQAKVYAEFSTAGAGFERIILSEFWQTAGESRQARAHYEALDRGDRQPPPLPDPADQYLLQQAQPLVVADPATGSFVLVPVPLLAADQVEINGAKVRLSNRYTDQDGRTWTFWSEKAPGVFEATVVDAKDRPVARLERRFTLGESYDITIAQRVKNLTDKALRARWVQYGPGDLIEDRSRYMDMRRFLFGYRPNPAAFPDVIVSGNGDLLLHRHKVRKNAVKADKSTDPARRAELTTLWPTGETSEKGYDLAWFATTNRYFVLAVHPAPRPPGPVPLTIEPVVEEIRTRVSTPAPDVDIIFTGLYSPERFIDPGGETDFDMGVYAGPLDRNILAEQEPMAALHMQELILYQMSAWCAMCTFQWLARGLLVFLSVVHMLIGDWGVAIIILVVIVRTLLHPLTRKAQVNMQRFGKVMGDLKPEIDKLQKKYPNDSKKLQQEQMKLMRERGVNPFQMLGCLPLFLQMPIWVALYAMLYFAFELRHEPAFWGFFQLFWGWPFLADLSSADHCFWEFAQPFHFLLWNVTGINALPFLMGLVFFFQQKYMTPPPSPTMTREQIQQQKIMKWMMVVMFPLMLYSAPSGLTLYIFTSSLMGIIESKYIRAHIKALELNPPEPKSKTKKPRDPRARMFADAIERAREKARAKREAPKKFKKRK